MPINEGGIKMLLGSWENITLICGNHGEDESIEMVIHEGPHSLFYSCPEYRSIYGNRHEKKSCNNRLNLVDYTKMLDHMMGLIYDEYGNQNSIVGYVWKKNGVEYKVLKQEGDHIWVKMLNKKAINS